MIAALGNYVIAHMQDKYRPRVFAGLVVGTVVGTAGSAFAASQHEYFAAGFAGAIASFCCLVVVASSTGLIVPIRYDI